MGEGAAAELGGARHQKGVGRRADADHEHARTATHRRDRLEQLLLVADRAVGQEHDLANHVAVNELVGQRGTHRRHHLGAAARLQRTDEGARLIDMRGIRPRRGRKQHVHGVIETDHVEAVIRLEAAEGIEQARLGLNDGGAAHRSRIIDHEHDLARQRLLSCLLGAGRRDEGEQVIGIADMLAEQADRWRRARGRLPGQLEVTIGGDSAISERDDTRRVVGTLDLDVMVVAPDLAEREAGLQAHRDAGRVDRRIPGGVQDCRGDAIAVGHGIGRRGAPAGAVLAEVDALYDRCRIVARSDHQRHAERIFIAGLVHRLLIFDLHQHGLAGTDIGHRIGEDVRPLLLGQRGLLARAARLLVDHASPLPLLDVADDDAVADHHLQRVDGTIGGERIDIGGRDPVPGRIAEHLRDAGAQRRTRHGDVDVGAEANRLGGGAVLLQQQAARPRLARLEQAGLFGRRRPTRSEAHQQGHEGDQDHRDALREEEQSELDQSAQDRAFVAVGCVVGIHLACSKGLFAGSQDRPGEADFASRMIGNVPPRPARAGCRRVATCGFVLVCPPC